MKVLTVRQPWAWLIVHAGKDIENRTWRTSYRGPLAIQASKAKPRAHDMACAVAYARERGVEVPANLEYGGIIGTVDLIDCADWHESPWYMGDVAWVLRDPRPTEFIPCHGQLGIFDFTPASPAAGR